MQNSKINEMKEFNKSRDDLAKYLIKFLKDLGSERVFTKEQNQINEKLLDFLHDDFKHNLLK
jgi:hypothetical protein